MRIPNNAPEMNWRRLYRISAARMVGAVTILRLVNWILCAFGAGEVSELKTRRTAGLQLIGAVLCSGVPLGRQPGETYALLKLIVQNCMPPPGNSFGAKGMFRAAAEVIGIVLAQQASAGGFRCDVCDI